MSATDATPDLAGATPVMAQFLEMKAAHPGYLLFFRMGDFYELFFDDAVAAAGALGIALTKRGKHAGDDIPMCGVPIHNAERYLHDLIRAGFRVAVAEQMEDPAEAKKRGSKSVVKREVVRLVTAGTLTEEALLEGGANNFLAVYADKPAPGALAWTDLSTGVVRATICAAAALPAELARLRPSEVVHRAGADLRDVIEEAGAVATEAAAASFRPSAAAQRAADAYGVASLDAFGAFSEAEAAAIGALVDYIRLTQRSAAPMLRPPEREEPGGVMRIDAATRRNLELTRALDGGREGSLLSVVDRTVSNAGGRRLAERLAAPLTDVGAIRAAQAAVAYFLEQPSLRRALREKLRRAPDLERALSRLHLGRGGPRDLAALRDAIAVGAALEAAVAGADGLTAPPEAVAQVLGALTGHEALADTLGRALVAEPPFRVADGGFVADGYSQELDDVRSLRDRSRQVIAELQADYQALTELPALKIKHNNMLGYFIETPIAHQRRLMTSPLDQTFIHRQTMANAARFTTATLADLESRISRAGDLAAGLEKAIFAALVEEAVGAAPRLTALAGAMAELDAQAALAELAETEGYCRPEIVEDRSFLIEGGRHPVVEAALKRGGGDAFQPNDCDLGADGAAATPIWVVTGPNMAGKSTFLRQNALIAALAQTGAFVPARRARIGVVDRLFSRVGASDDLARGRSTFMVEMVETAAILNQAGERALVILDEIGRGTATYDGLAIAWATLEHLEAENRCRALFATHYHELTTLAAARPGMANVTVAVREWKGDIVFLREIRAGAADRSYGVQVATLAGLPKAVTARAKALLAKLEGADNGPAARAQALVDDLPLFAAAKAEADAPTASAVEALLGEIDPDSLSPREALEALYKLKAALKRVDP